MKTKRSRKRETRRIRMLRKQVDVLVAIIAMQPQHRCECERDPIRDSYAYGM